MGKSESKYSCWGEEAGSGPGYSGSVISTFPRRLLNAPLACRLGAIFQVFRKWGYRERVFDLRDGGVVGNRRTKESTQLRELRKGGFGEY